MRLAAERRQSDRTPIARPCKLARGEGAPMRFDPGQTVNLSTSGALIEVRSHRPLAVGERIALGVAWGERPLLSADSLTRGRVIRTSPVAADAHGKSGVQLVAVEFEGRRAPSLATAA
jgi:hypothetical protein